MADVAGIYARESTFLDRYVQVGIAQGRVISLGLPREPDEEAEPDHELLDRIETYLQGEEDTFEDVTVALTLPTDQREILEAVRGIPYGRDISVEKLARMVPGRSGDDGSDLADIREALAANPAPILVPGHRVRDGPSGLPPDVEPKLRSLEGLR